MTISRVHFDLRPRPCPFYSTATKRHIWKYETSTSNTWTSQFFTCGVKQTVSWNSPRWLVLPCVLWQRADSRSADSVASPLPEQLSVVHPQLLPVQLPTAWLSVRILVTDPVGCLPLSLLTSGLWSSALYFPLGVLQPERNWLYFFIALEKVTSNLFWFRLILEKQWEECESPREGYSLKGYTGRLRPRGVPLSGFTSKIQL